jgi:alkylhydroperoxidase family enzyme
MLAHGSILRRRFYSAEQMTAIAGHTATAGLPAADVAMMSFAEKLARDASAITEADARALREHGLTDAEIFDVAATAAARCFFSKHRLRAANGARWARVRE